MDLEQLETALAILDASRLRSSPLYVPFTKDLPPNFDAFVIAINEVINSFSDIPETIKRELLNECYWWYVYCLKYGRLFGRTISLKSDLRSIYKQYREDLKGFDRLMQKVRNVFKTYCDTD
jgi:hypothetical protein